jgi:ABC-2 type transport system ATP-binding protein
MIELRNVGRRFGAKWAVRGLDLKVPGGEVFGLLGPNGAGKTTAIRMMTGLLSPTEGGVMISGFDIDKDPVDAKSVTGYIPDTAFFYEKLTVREFMHFSAALYGLNPADARRRAGDLAAMFGIADITDSLIEGCSHGMRQRLLFATALIHQPGVLIIDEPFVGLDPFGVTLVKDTIKDLASSGVAVFLATHSLHIAAELCQRIGLIREGRLVALKDSREVESFEGGLEGLFIKELGGDGNPH